MRVSSTWKLPSQLNPCHQKSMLLTPELRPGTSVFSGFLTTPSTVLLGHSGVVWYLIKALTSSPDQPVSSLLHPCCLPLEPQGTLPPHTHLLTSCLLPMAPRKVITICQHVGPPSSPLWVLGTSLNVPINLLTSGHIYTTWNRYLSSWLPVTDPK